MSVVQELRQEIRDFIQHPRRLNRFLADKPNWNMLASSFDIVADTEFAIGTYEAMQEVKETGMLYLVIYGLLQALYVQQDAVESMVRAFEPSAARRYKIEDEPEACGIREVRNRAVGHPTVEGNAKSRKAPGQQKSHGIVQHSMHKDGFVLVTSFADGRDTREHVCIPDLIQTNRTMVERVLSRIKDRLEAAEMEHRKTFREEKLADIFPETLDYCFEKILAGTDCPSGGAGQWGKMHLDTLDGKVQEFRTTLEKRGVLNRSSDYEYYLAEVEYPIGELRKYFDETGSLHDPRAAHIFACFIQDRVPQLRRIAIELDEEYKEDLGGKPDPGNTVG